MAKKGKFVVNKKRPLDMPSDSPPRIKASQVTLVQRLEFVLSLLNRLLIGFITIYILWLCLRQNSADIPWHACLCTLGFSCLMAEGLMAHYRGNAGTQICPRPEKTRTHWILQLVGSLFGVAGIMVKIMLEDVHFNTLHGQLGLAAFILCMTSLMSGLISIYAAELKKYIQPLLSKATHNLLGLTTFTLAMCSTLTAFDTDLFIEYSVDAALFRDFRLILKIVTILIWFLSSYGPFWCLIYSKLWKR